MGERKALSQLDPIFEPSPASSAAQRLNFLCPNCGKRRIHVDIWNGKAGNVQTERGLFFLWHADQDASRDLKTLTITPSIDHQHGGENPDRPCRGWHGFITNGEATNAALAERGA